MKVAVVGTSFAGFGAVVALTREPKVAIHVFDIGLRSRKTGQTDIPVPNAKPSEGSFFPYGLNDPRWSVRLNSQRICSSHAFGGYSLVYSGSMLYPKGDDLAEWPDSSRPTAADYTSVLKHLEILRESDAVEKEFPIPPADSVLAAGRAKGKESFCWGLSRVAVKKARPDTSGFKEVFRTTEFFAELEKNKKVFYHPDCYVNKVSHADGSVRLWVETSPGQFAWSETFDAVFVGAGCVNTTGIIDRSLFPQGIRSYEIKSVGGFIRAYLGLPRSLEDGHALRRKACLPEFFLEMVSAQTKNTWSHTQITGINDQILSAITSKIPVLGKIAQACKDLFYFSLTCVHSRHSPRISLICRSKEGHESILAIEEKGAPFEFREFQKAVSTAVCQQWKKLRLLPLPWSGKVADFFRGNRLGGWHFGGTLPMCELPKSGQCKPSGEVCGLTGVYVVDSAAFPEIPGSTIALLISAHAHHVAQGWIIRQTGAHSHAH